MSRGLSHQKSRARSEPIARGSIYGCRPVLAFLVLGTVSFGGPDPVDAAEKVTGKLIVKDILAKPREELTLEARLVKEGLLGESGLGGEPLEFYVGGLRAGTALTGGDGRARCCEKAFTTPMRGNQIIRVKLSGSPRVKDTEATGTLFSWERRRPIIVVELIALIEEGKLPVGLPAVPLQMGLQELPPPLPDAAKNLDRLTQYFFNVVYVSRTGTVDREGLRGWLHEHNFPEGVQRVVQPGKRGIAAILDELKERGFDTLGGGIGRTRDFAESFAERRINIVVLSESGEERNFPRKTKWAKDWLEVRRKIQG